MFKLQATSRDNLNGYIAAEFYAPEKISVKQLHLRGACNQPLKLFKGLRFLYLLLNNSIFYFDRVFHAFIHNICSWRICAYLFLQECVVCEDVSNFLLSQYVVQHNILIKHELMKQAISCNDLFYSKIPLDINLLKIILDISLLAFTCSIHSKCIKIIRSVFAYRVTRIHFIQLTVIFLYYVIHIEYTVDS